jgi:hypothetical protein
MSRVVSEKAPASTIIRLDAFMRRFTAAERTALELAGAHDPAASTGAKADAAEARAIARLLFTYPTVDTADGSVSVALTRLQVLGVLASGRPETIGAAPAFEDRP